MPTTFPSDRARALLLSIHYLSGENLQAAIGSISIDVWTKKTTAKHRHTTLSALIKDSVLSPKTARETLTEFDAELRNLALESCIKLGQRGFGQTFRTMKALKCLSHTIQAYRPPKGLDVHDPMLDHNFGTFIAQNAASIGATEIFTTSRGDSFCARAGARPVSRATVPQSKSGPWA